jgi:hypothetical protein
MKKPEAFITRARTSWTIVPVIILLLSFSAISCDKEKENEEVTQTLEIDVTGTFLQWVYFSFEKNELVAIEDHMNSLDWDLGIRYQNFRTNGGDGGKGQGGVYDLGVVNFEEVKLADISGATFVEDDSIQVIKSVGMPPVWEKVPGSVPLEGMFLTPTGPNRTYTPNNHVYVIKTAKGKHVKLQGITFFNDEALEGFFNFKFEFLD